MVVWLGSWPLEARPISVITGIDGVDAVNMVRYFRRSSGVALRHLACRNHHILAVQG